MKCSWRMGRHFEGDGIARKARCRGAIGIVGNDCALDSQLLQAVSGDAGVSCHARVAAMNLAMKRNYRKVHLAAQRSKYGTV